MIKTASLNIRIDPELKKNAEALYSRFGLTISDAITVFLNKSLMENGFPFDLTQPRYNVEMEASIKEARQILEDPNAKMFNNVEDMFAELDSEI